MRCQFKQSWHPAFRRQDLQALRQLRCGGAALELAIALPLLMLLSLGCMDFGRIAYFSISLNNAVGSGLTVATTHRYTPYTRTTWENQIRLAVQEDLQSITGFKLSDVAQTITTTEIADQPTAVTLKVTYPFKTIVKWPGIPTTLVLRQTLSGNQYR